RLAPRMKAASGWRSGRSSGTSRPPVNESHDSGEPLRRGGTMMRKAGRSRASEHAKRVIAVLVPIMGLVVWPVRSAAAGPGVATLAAQAIGSKPQLARLTAATRIGDKAPEGWTHLVIKSIPELKSGDLDTLPEVANKTATMFHTVMLADVQPVGLDRQFILSR